MNHFLTVALLALALPQLAAAQDFKMKFASSRNPKLVLAMRGSDVTVEGTDSDELTIVGSGHTTTLPSLANGLRPVYGGSDNTRLGLAVAAGDDNSIRVTWTAQSEGHYTLRVPRQTDISFANNDWNTSDDLTLRDLSGRIEVRLTSGDLKLLNVSGPVVANTVSGDIQVKFSGVPTQPSAITAVSGDLDVTMPAPAKTNLSMRSISGEIYTDFDLSLIGGNGLTHVGGQTIEGRTNGGGVSLALKTISGDIFLRKAK